MLNKLCAQIATMVCHVSQARSQRATRDNWGSRGAGITSWWASDLQAEKLPKGALGADTLGMVKAHGRKEKYMKKPPGTISH